ncbi:MAG: hypothetical protein LQ337_008535, partial [Flavoplaca oasis]
IVDTEAKGQGVKIDKDNIPLADIFDDDDKSKGAGAEEEYAEARQVSPYSTQSAGMNLDIAFGPWQIVIPVNMLRTEK